MDQTRLDDASEKAVKLHGEFCNKQRGKIAEYQWAMHDYDLERYALLSIYTSCDGASGRILCTRGLCYNRDIQRPIPL
jgi:hypothetical protein